MSKTIEVRTPFIDVSALAQGFVKRVHEERLMLPTATPVAPGESAQFSVSLKDGTIAFAGTGSSVQVYDRGDKVRSEVRYEVLLEQLQFEPASKRVFDHLVLVSHAVLKTKPRAEEIPVASESKAVTAEAQQSAAESIREPEPAPEAPRRSEPQYAPAPEPRAIRSKGRTGARTSRRGTRKHTGRTVYGELAADRQTAGDSRQ